MARKNRRNRNRNRQKLEATSNNQTINPEDEIKNEEQSSDCVVNEESIDATECIEVTAASTGILKDVSSIDHPVKKENCRALLEPAATKANVLNVPKFSATDCPLSSKIMTKGVQKAVCNEITSKITELRSEDNLKTLESIKGCCEKLSCTLNEVPLSQHLAKINNSFKDNNSLSPPKTIAEDSFVFSLSNHSASYETDMQKGSTLLEDFNEICTESPEASVKDCCASTQIVSGDLPALPEDACEDLIAPLKTVDEICPESLKNVTQDQLASLEITDKDCMTLSKSLVEGCLSSPATVTKICPVPSETAAEDNLASSKSDREDCPAFFEGNVLKNHAPLEIIAIESNISSENVVEECHESFLIIAKDCQKSLETVTKMCPASSETVVKDCSESSETGTEACPVSLKDIVHDYSASTKAMAHIYRGPPKTLAKDCPESSENVPEECPVSLEAFKPLLSEAVVQDPPASLETINEDCIPSSEINVEDSRISPERDIELYIGSPESQDSPVPLENILATLSQDYPAFSSQDCSAPLETTKDCLKADESQSSDIKVPAQPKSCVSSAEPTKSSDSAHFGDLIAHTDSASCSVLVSDCGDTAMELSATNNGVTSIELFVSNDGISITEPTLSNNSATFAKLVTPKVDISETSTFCFGPNRCSSSVESHLSIANISITSKDTVISNTLLANVSKVELCSSCQQSSTEKNIVRSTATSSECTISNPSQLFSLLDNTDLQSVFKDMLIMLWLLLIGFPVQILMFLLKIFTKNN